MSNSLVDLLARAGIITPQVQAGVNAKKQQSRNTAPATGQTTKPNRSLALLDSYNSITYFRRTAREILQKDPSKIMEVITSARRFSDTKAGGALMYALYKIKHVGIENMYPEKREGFLRRELHDPLN
ncbi:MAG: hypothetical protein HY764_02180 [Candidatus Portnoybacteria bacterium]|nr:hypothetical protein [Candidatus Portnoybacteria bacterium]